MVTLVQLEHAALVAKHGSFSEAARQSNVTQPTISNSISDLEERLGKKLFVRTTRRVELSPFGRALIPSIEDALQASNRVSAEAEALINPEKKLLRVAYTPLLDIKRINGICAAYRQAKPDVEIVFKECTHESLTDRLLLEQIDIVFAHDVPRRREFGRCKMFCDPLHFVPPNGEHAESNSISLQDIALNTLLLTVGGCGLAPTTQALFEAAQISTDIYPGRAMTHFGLQEWAELGLGGAVLPASRISGGADRFSKLCSNSGDISIKYEAIWQKSSLATQHLNDFVATIPDVCRIAMQKTGSW